MSKEEASVALGKFLATYGEEALKNLVEAVQSGELDDTIERFANGEAGEVNGPGDGSGVDDKVPASLEGQARCVACRWRVCTSCKDSRCKLD